METAGWTQHSNCSDSDEEDEGEKGDDYPDSNEEEGDETRDNHSDSDKENEDEEKADDHLNSGKDNERSFRVRIQVQIISLYPRIKRSTPRIPNLLIQLHITRLQVHLMMQWCNYYLVNYLSPQDHLSFTQRHYHGYCHFSLTTHYIIRFYACSMFSHTERT